MVLDFDRLNYIYNGNPTFSHNQFFDEIEFDRIFGETMINKYILLIVPYKRRVLIVITVKIFIGNLYEKKLVSQLRCKSPEYKELANRI